MGEAKQADVTELGVKGIHELSREKKGQNNGQRLIARPPAFFRAFGDEEDGTKIGGGQNQQIGPATNLAGLRK